MFFPFGKTLHIYGGKFLEYLTKTYGTDTLSKLNIEHSKTFMGYGTLYYPKHSFDKEAKSIFGKPFEELYNEWRGAEEKNSESWITIGTHIPLDGQIKNYLLNYNGNLYLQQNSYIHPSPHYYLKNYILRPILRKHKTGKISFNYINLHLNLLKFTMIIYILLLLTLQMVMIIFLFLGLAI